eukprot:COSAG02_NODE_6781_length_3363_cov_143.625361_2_plen_84_part_00
MVPTRRDQLGRELDCFLSGQLWLESRIRFQLKFRTILKQPQYRRLPEAYKIHTLDPDNFTAVLVWVLLRIEPCSGSTRSAQVE